MNWMALFIIVFGIACFSFGYWMGRPNWKLIDRSVTKGSGGGA